MRPAWTGVLLGKMHNHNVTQLDIANKVGCCKAYVSMVFRGERNPAGAKEKFYNAYDEIIKEREANSKS